MNIQLISLSIFDIIISILFFVVPLGISAVFFAQIVPTINFSSPRRPILTPIFFVGIIILTLFIYTGSKITPAIPNSPPFACSTTLFAGVVGLTVTFLNGRRKITADHILLDLGQVDSKGQALFGLFIFFITFLITDMMRYTGVYIIVEWVTAACLIAVGIFQIWLALSKVYITKQGLNLLSGTLPWEQIQSYEWGEELGGKIKLFLNGTIKLSFFVFLDQQQELDQIFQERINGNGLKEEKT